MVKSKGLGDTIEKITKATGIKKVVDTISEATGVPCECEKRKELLNKIFPYKVRQFTPDEIKIYEEIIPRVKNGIVKGKDYANLLQLYNKTFNTNKKASNCSPCVKDTLNKLKKVYESSCEL